MERKRHIGNDIVNIVFIDQLENEGENDVVLPTLFDPTWIKSQFTRKFFEKKNYINLRLILIFVRYICCRHQNTKHLSFGGVLR